MDIETRAGRTRADFRVPLVPAEVLERLRTIGDGRGCFRLLEGDEAHVTLKARLGRGMRGGRIALRFVQLDEHDTMVISEWTPRLRRTASAREQGERDLETIAGLLGSVEP